MRKQRETERNHQRRDEVGDKGVGCHFFQVASQFGRHDSGGGSGRTNDADQNGFEQDKSVASDTETEDQAYKNQNENDLLEGHPQVPSDGQQFLKIDFAESNEKDDEHEVGEDICIVRSIPLSDRTERRDKMEEKIDGRAGGHCYGKRPVLNKSDSFIHWLEFFAANLLIYLGKMYICGRKFGMTWEFLYLCGKLKTPETFVDVFSQMFRTLNKINRMKSKLAQSIEVLRESVQQTIFRFPVTVVAAIGLAIIQCVWVLRKNWLLDFDYWTYFFAVAILISAMFHLWREETANKRRVDILHGGFLVLLGIDTLILREIVVSTEIWLGHCAVILSFTICAVFISFFREKDDVPSWNFFRCILISALLCLIVSGIMTLGVCSLYFGMARLFGWQMEFKIYQVLMILFMLLLPILMFLMRIPKGPEKHDTEPYFSKFIAATTRYLFIPLVVCYVVVLYVYLGRIIIAWELPQGTVAWMVTCMMVGFLLVEFMLYPSIRRERAKAFERWVAHWMSILMLPLLVLMSVGIARRLGDYGITPKRLYMLTLNVWFYAVCLGIFFNSLRRLHWIPLSFAALFVLTSSQPFNYFRVTEKKMISTLERAIAEYDHPALPMESDAFLTWVKELPVEEGRKVYSAVQYLHMERKEMKIAQYVPNLRYAYRDFEHISMEEQEVEPLVHFRLDKHPYTIPVGYASARHIDVWGIGEEQVSIGEDTIRIRTKGYTFVVDIEEANRHREALESDTLAISNYVVRTDAPSVVFLPYSIFVIPGQDFRASLEGILLFKEGIVSNNDELAEPQPIH